VQLCHPFLASPPIACPESLNPDPYKIDFRALAATTARHAAARAASLTLSMLALSVLCLLQRVYHRASQCALGNVVTNATDCSTRQNTR
jgi:hypothetical protein